MKNMLTALFAMLALASGGLTAIAAGEQAQATQHSQECARVCEGALEYIKQKGGDHASPERVKLMQDCITICKANEDFAIRGSQFAERMSDLCAEICRKCAESCDSLDDKALADCVEMCRKCSSACHKGDGDSGKKKAATDSAAAVTTASAGMSCCPEAAPAN